VVEDVQFARLKALGLGLSGEKTRVLVFLTSHYSGRVETILAGRPRRGEPVLDEVKMPSGYTGSAAIWW
jgi:hypothetical protein